MVLSVVFDEVLHKLRVAKRCCACIVLVYLGYLSHIVITQREIEDADILRHALLMA